MGGEGQASKALPLQTGGGKCFEAVLVQNTVTNLTLKLVTSGK